MNWPAILDEKLKRKADAREAAEATQRAEERALRIQIMREEHGIPKYLEPCDMNDGHVN